VNGIRVIVIIDSLAEERKSLYSNPNRSPPLFERPTMSDLDPEFNKRMREEQKRYSEEQKRLGRIPRDCPHCEYYADQPFLCCGYYPGKLTGIRDRITYCIPCSKFSLSTIDQKEALHG